MFGEFDRLAQYAEQTPDFELFIGGIPAGVDIRNHPLTSGDLRKHFQQFGPIEECRMKQDKLTSKGFFNTR